MSRIVADEEAAAVVDNGNADFRVIGATSVKDSKYPGTMFVVQVPLTVIRDGLFGPVSNTIGGNGKPTKFGFSLFGVLNALPCVEASLDHGLRDAVTIFVSADMSDQPPAGFRNQSHGLPASVCYTIQKQIMRHRTLPCQLVEYIRRAI